jgi:hypothetical protein
MKFVDYLRRLMSSDSQSGADRSKPATAIDEIDGDSTSVNPRGERESRPIPSVSSRSLLRTTIDTAKTTSALVSDSIDDQSDTQFPRDSKSENRPPLDVYIGLDFGTSSSKIVIQTPTLAGGRAVPIPFGDVGHSSSEYLLPTILFHHVDGRFGLSDADGAQVIENLKVRLMEPSPPLEVVNHAVAYLALAIRAARQWFIQTQRKEIGVRNLRWHLNVGIPSPGYGDQQMSEGFRTAAELAWVVSTGKGPVTEKLIEQAWQSPEPEIEVELVPEVAAEVVGYARSTKRRPGLHMMVDVGATTLDVCGFILHEVEGDDRYSLLTASVARLGVYELYRSRVAAVCENEGRIRAEAERGHDPLQPVPIGLDQYIESDRVPDYLRKADDEFHRQCVTPVSEAIMAIRKRRDPNALAFREGLPVFLCGGGARLDFYREIVDEASRRFCNATFDTQPFVVMPVERPDVLIDDQVDSDLYGRLAVAYGLSFDSFDIGEIQPPFEIGDIQPKARRPGSQAFVSKDDV